MRSAWLGLLLLSACASGDGAVADPTTTPTTVAVGNTAQGDTADEPTAVEGTTPPTTGASGTVPSTTERTVVSPEGFATTEAIVTKADGTTCEVCVWLADTARQRSRGLMFATDLAPAEAMAFRYPDPHTGTFWMKNTVLPLSIAFFAPDGSFLESFDMEPCTTDSCPRYRTPRDFLVAVEVPQGGLAELGLVAGSRLELLDVSCVAAPSG